MAYGNMCSVISVRDLANLAGDAYSNTVTSRAGGWHVQRRKLEAHHHRSRAGVITRHVRGFAAAVYKRHRQIVIAFRGTELSDAKDLRDDAMLAMGHASPQMRMATALVASLCASSRGAETWLTGHSLGGALAIYAALAQGLPAATFNAPAMGRVVYRMDHKRVVAPIYNFVYGGDAVSGMTGGAKAQIGKTIHVPARQFHNPLTHQTIEMQSALRDHKLSNFHEYLDAHPARAALPPDRW